MISLGSYLAPIYDTWKSARSWTCINILIFTQHSMCTVDFKIISSNPISINLLTLSSENKVWGNFFMELGWGVDEGSTWCLDEVGVDLGWRCCRRLRVVTAFLRVCSTDSWFHSSFGSCSVNFGYLVAPWWSILDDCSVDLRFITLVVWWYFPKVWYKYSLTDPVSKIQWAVLERSEAQGS